LTFSICNHNKQVTKLPSLFQVTFLDQQQFLLQQINFPLHQQQFDTQSRAGDEQQQSANNQPEQQRAGTAQGFIDESGNLCILQFGPEPLDDCEEAAAAATGATTKSRHSTREKTRSSQKRRKKKKARQQKTKATKVFGKNVGWAGSELNSSSLISLSLIHRLFCAKLIGERGGAHSI
jgi:hypothetical protein